MKVFVKFGQKKHLRRSLRYNRYYFGIAKQYKTIETQQKIKGQGDNREATLTVKGIDSAKMVQYQTGEDRSLPPSSKIEILNDEAAHIPAYCLSLIDAEKNCVLSNGKKLISPGFMKTIREHFPNADAALIFRNYNLVRKAFEHAFSSVRMGEITYPWMSENGASIEYIEHTMTEITEREYYASIPYLIMKCIFTPTDGSPNRYFSTAKKDAYKILFCKEPFFSGEQEYRFVLPNTRLEEHGEEFLVRGIPKTEKTLLSIDDFSYEFDFLDLMN